MGHGRDNRCIEETLTNDCKGVEKLPKSCLSTVETMYFSKSLSPLVSDLSKDESTERIEEGMK